MVTQQGKMTERITFQAQTAVPDGIGGQTKAWVSIPNLPTVWAEVVAKAGREKLVADRMAASMTTLFRILNRDDLDETMRLVWRGSNYNIRGVRREGSHSRYLTIEAERGVAT